MSISVLLHLWAIGVVCVQKNTNTCSRTMVGMQQNGGKHKIDWCAVVGVQQRGGKDWIAAEQF